MLSENHRISKLAKKKTNHNPSPQRLPVVRTTLQDYTLQPVLRKIITIYKNKLRNQPKSISKQKKTSTSPLTNTLNPTDQLTLILAHGRAHTNYTFLPKPALLLDINPVAAPDILGDMLNKTFMERFPTNYFDQVFMMYTAPPHSFHKRNNQLWRNLYRLLKKTGTIKSYYINKVYSKRLRHLGKKQLQIYLEKIGPSHLFKITLSGSLIILTKI